MRREFSSWRTGAPYYLPPLLLGAAGTWLVSGTLWWPLPLALFLSGVFALNFFRDPPRRIPPNPADITSPADGKVVSIEDLPASPYYDGPCRCVSIFLNVFDVHINRAPAACEVTRIDYKPGAYKNAMSGEAREVNESNNLWLATAHGPMTLRQISGAVARRIVCVPEKGDSLSKGEKFGMIKFGSRTELFLPPDAAIRVTLNQKIKAGSTILASFEKTSE